jgi:hypothetical protein
VQLTPLSTHWAPRKKNKKGYNLFRTPCIKLKNTTTGEIEKIIKELKSKKSCGFDEITREIFKISSPFVVSPLTHRLYVMECFQLEHFGQTIHKLNLYITKGTKHKSPITGQFH